MRSSRYIGCSQYIGHVGALAVALGLGAAVVSGTGVAWASESSAAGTTSSSSAASSSSASVDAPAAAADKPATPTQSDTQAEPDKPAGKPAAKDTEDTEDTDVADETQGRVHDAEQNEEAAQADAPENAPASTDDERESEPPAHPARKWTTQPETAAAVDTDAIAAPAPAAPAAAPAVAAVDVVADTVKDLADPFSGGTPATPADSPAQWAEAAVARREISGSGSGPITSDVKVGLTDQVITGGVNAKDATAANILTYEVVGKPNAGGKVTLDAAKGTFTFLPDASVLTRRGTETFQVRVSELTPIVAALQTLPVVGLLVAPVVILLREVPVVGQLLAPVIGVSIVVPVAVHIGKVVPAGTPIAFTTMVKSPVDGTLISTNFFPALGLGKGQRAPTILDAPGLAIPGDTDPFGDGSTSTGFGVATFRAAGYNVVTWDPRGEFASGGVLRLDSPDYEARDVSGIISWLANRPEALRDGPGDPRLGMVGFSYGGGVQLVTAATDHRVDAIVPGIAWNTLNSSLYRDEAFRTGYALLLMLRLVTMGAVVDPRIYPAILGGAVTGSLSAEQQEILASSGPGDLVARITAPTLLLQGTVDVLFPLQQAMTNAQLLDAANVPVKMVWFCGGHGDCETPDDDNAAIRSATMAWLDRWVMRKTTVDTGPTFEWIDQNGQYYSSDVLPTDKTFHGDPVVVTGGGGVLPIIPLIGGSGPSTHVNFPYSIGDGEVAGLAVDIPIEPGRAAQIVGAPELTFTYSGLGTATHIYAQLIDDNTHLVIGNLVTPVSVRLDGTRQTAQVSLEAIAQTMSATDSLTLQLVGSATAYENLTAFGVITISDVSVSLPTVAAGVATETGQPSTVFAQAA